MTYKNEIKEYTMITLLFGAPMGFLFVKAQEKKYDKKRLEIAKEKNIICDGGATIQGNGGWMFFTEHGLEFYPHQIYY